MEEHLAEHAMPLARNILLPILVTLATIYVQKWADRRWARPNVEILGVLPIHLHGRTALKDGDREIVFHDHRLGVILKARNDTATDSVMSLAIIEGCVHIDPIDADFGLPEEDRIFRDGISLNDPRFKAREKAVARISVSGGPRDGVALIPAYGTVYIPVLFPFPAGRTGARLEVVGSVSPAGKCKKIKVANTQPPITDVLDFKRIHSDVPQHLRPEFSDGQLKLAVFAGNEKVSVDPSVMLPLRRISAKLWEALDVARMYENPDEEYPPVQDQDS